ncbi:hypothetical protein PV735_32075 [Streptomyces turgidiscabies]|uniref:Uncharacterized protein n=1 Tax=Streptomyces turgidiscabies (strain Car8) TaxID=698760 RepID=L7ER70_STRT8|nr:MULTISPECIES: hypothetical protein [Streptomyces]ELP61517.1 hypothetical protein STRTUCAR8_03644 [Streptomyces turgidiscabies Car8]MDX3497290.1 hypothetical protein [Streptomyces turgidiscabies]GAQ68613.1 hypothetical protein T45_00324 [Streptomyces turgidiscabies]
MEVTGVMLLLIVLLAPGFKNLLKSVAYRIRAAGKADVIRAKREVEQNRSKGSTRSKTKRRRRG